MGFVDSYKSLIDSIRKIEEVMAIGKSGGEQLPAENEGDIDIFVFCDQIPTRERRESAVDELKTAVSRVTINERGGRFWGTCDFLSIGEAEVCLMYFTVSSMNEEIEKVLDGSRIEREGEYFYPTGRCATFLSMYILYDETNYISDMKRKLNTYPVLLAEKLFEYHIKMINDAEDFDRAVSRGDVLFYHATFERAMDHYLQALFALNRCFFPSRKRTLQFVKHFPLKPIDCSARLIKAVELGAREETLYHSYQVWSALCDDLTAFL